MLDSDGPRFQLQKLEWHVQTSITVLDDQVSSPVGRTHDDDSVAFHQRDVTVSFF